ncbi:MAG: RHS repeat-associated core domain-containing protein [Thermoflexibacter sp.]|jgi:RHS repeat-associated protein|nr:RHS repeat-associated core domain-containing protein [Thermoflexibacter sp.]
MKGLDYTAPSPNRENKFTFNGQTEKETKLNLNWHETAFRGYDPQLGRFHQIDPLADLFTGINPYQFGYNNPVLFNDPTGLASPTPNPKCKDCIQRRDPVIEKMGKPNGSSGGTGMAGVVVGGGVPQGGNTPSGGSIPQPISGNITLFIGRSVIANQYRISSITLAVRQADMLGSDNPDYRNLIVYEEGRLQPFNNLPTDGNTRARAVSVDYTIGGSAVPNPITFTIGGGEIFQRNQGGARWGNHSLFRRFINTVYSRQILQTYPK